MCRKNRCYLFSNTYCDHRKIALSYQSRVCLGRFDANRFGTRNSIFVGIRVQGYLGQNVRTFYTFGALHGNDMGRLRCIGSPRTRFCTRDSVAFWFFVYFFNKDLIFRCEYSKGSVGIVPASDSGVYSPQLAAPALAGFRARLSLALVPVKETTEISNSNQRPTIVDTTIETLTNCVCAIRFLRNSSSPFYCRRVHLPPRRISRSLGARSSPVVRRALTSNNTKRKIITNKVRKLNTPDERVNCSL